MYLLSIVKLKGTRTHIENINLFGLKIVKQGITK